VNPAPIANRSMPPGAFIPELAYPDVAAAAAWLCMAFGFEERLRIGTHRIQLVFGGGAMVVTEEASRREAGPRDPDAAPGHRVMVRVADVNRHHERAAKCGATILSPPADHPFGERQYAAEDLGGHRWVFSQSIADIDPRDWGGLRIEGAGDRA
jgi:uncharacterized glyoxalase superfamily protein PhnB